MADTFEGEQRVPVAEGTRGRRWAFTWFDYTEAIVNDLKTIDSKRCDYLTFGFEVTADGKKHIQGYVEFKTPLSLSAVKGRLDTVRKTKSPVHVQGAYKSRDANIRYCRKVDSTDADAVATWGSKWFEVSHVAKKQGKRSDWEQIKDAIYEGADASEIDHAFPEHAIRYSSGIKNMIDNAANKRELEAVKGEYDATTLMPWQARLLRYLVCCKPDPRKVIWIWGEKGNVGKSHLSMHALAHHGAARFENSSSRDIAHAYNGQRIVFFDFSRTVEERVNYQILESMKNGFVFSPKYNSRQKIFPKPHVVIFANWGPRISAMSEDRWDIRCTDKWDPSDFIIGYAETGAESGEMSTYSETSTDPSTSVSTDMLHEEWSNANGFVPSDSDGAEQHCNTVTSVALGVIDNIEQIDDMLDFI